ncbi:MAG: LysE family transporter [Deltaproteobacteria bacterium]|nr:LysE family transporter [Deltaproteobacteria bacterium]MBW2640807.1 LysE family transporter [Deltaproteobacteria bacterium]MBW2679446.1 LysE family transporter [Deltaproteobacteria bacterium]
MVNFLAMGSILGLSAGFAPGPLLTLVISETLQHDIKAGVKVALAPMITDLPIIMLTLFILVKLSGFHRVLGIISCMGGLFVLYLGWQSIVTKGVELNLQGTRPRSLAKGIIVNTLNPHPYLFWLGVGGPTVTKAMNLGMVAPLAFIGSFYVLLVGSKILIAVLVGKSRSFLVGNGYIYTMRLLGVVLCALAMILFRDGFKLLGFI